MHDFEILLVSEGSRAAVAGILGLQHHFQLLGFAQLNWNFEGAGELAVADIFNRADPVRLVVLGVDADEDFVLIGVGPTVDPDGEFLLGDDPFDPVSWPLEDGDRGSPGLAGGLGNWLH